MKRITLLIGLGLLPCFTPTGRAAEALQPGLKAEIYSFDSAVEDFPTIATDKKATITRVDKDIDVDAGDGNWPGTELADHFFIRWTGKIRVAADGKYTFFLTSDDGSRLFLDGQQLIDNGGLHGADEKSGDVELKTGDHDLRIEFFENEGEAVCKLAWQAPGKDKEAVPAGVLFHGGAAAGGGPGLKAEIFAFDNAVEDFPTIGADKKPAVTRVDQTIDVDAGDGNWPGTELADHFYIRWTGTISIPADGKYAFFLNSDDGSRLFIDGQQVIDNGGLHGADEKSGEVELKSGSHDVKIEFFENEGEAVCKFLWQAPGKDKETVPAVVLSHGGATAAANTVAPGPGLKAEIYGFDSELEDFPALPADKKATVTRVDKDIDVDAGDGNWPGTELADHFYIRWTGKISLPTDGKYTFFLNSDDGSRLFVDGQQVIDNGGLHSADEKSGEVELKAGSHDLKIEFFENEGDAVCQFLWQAPGKDKEPVPASVLSH